MSYPRALVLSLSAAGLLLATQPARAEEPKPAPAPAAPEAPAAEVPIPWVKVWADAKAQAKKEKKDLLIDFTGSDWCGWCVRLEQEVFSQATFLENATKKFVFVYLDFPHGADKKAEVADAALNESLRDGYQVSGFPTIILANADGLPYARTGYQAGGPEGYLTHLDERKAEGVKVAALLAKGKQDLAAFKPGFEVLANAEFLGFADYAWVIDHAEKQDPDGSKGLKATVEAERARQRSAVEEKALLKIAKEATPETRMEKLYGFLKTSKDLRGMWLWKASVAVGTWLLNDKKDFAEAKRVFQLPLRDPDFAENEEAKAAIAEMVKGVDEAANPKPPEPKPDEPKPGTTK